MKRFIALFGAVVMTLAMAAPAGAYHGAPGMQIRMSRLDPLECGTNIRLAVDVVNHRGEAVSGIEVTVNLRFQYRPGDRVGPKLSTPYSEQTITDAEGRATSVEAAGRPYIKLTCRTGERILRATIRGHNGKILTRTSLVLDCRRACVS